MSTTRDFKPDFPIFTHHPKLVYLDNAATTHKPRQVIDAQQQFDEQHYATPHRGLYDLSHAATTAYEATRALIKTFINAKLPEEIIFTANATAALNLAAHLESQQLERGDEIILTTAEHHSNILPWQRVAKVTGAKLVWLELDPSHTFPLADFYRKINVRTKLVALAHISNVFGYIAPLEKVVAAAHQVNARVAVDAGQTAGHLPFNVQALGVDYAAFSGHKAYGPTGTGWLYAKQELLAQSEPLIVGGGTIKEVTKERVLWHDIPWRFEAGTGNMSGLVGLAAALQYLMEIGFDAVVQHEQALTQYAAQKLRSVGGLRIFGPATTQERVGIFSFQLTDNETVFHSHDVSTILNEFQVCVRAGHHCAQPLMRALGVHDVVRASIGLYNSQSDIDRLIEALEEAKTVLRRPQKNGPTVPTS